MNWLDTKAELIAAVEPNFALLGYRLMRAQNSLERKSENEIRFLFFGFVAKKDTLHKMRMWCGIQNRQIEAAFHRTSGVDERYRRNYTVVNIGMDNYLDLDSRTQIEKAKMECQRYIQEIAIPFLEKEYSFGDYSSMLNANPGEECEYHGNMENRCHYGLICAKLAGDPCYESAKEKYSAFLQSTNNGFYYPRFVALVADVEQGNV